MMRPRPCRPIHPHCGRWVNDFMLHLHKVPNAVSSNFCEGDRRGALSFAQISRSWKRAARSCALTIRYGCGDASAVYQSPCVETSVVGWGGRVRTCEWRHQKPLPYHLATPQRRRPYSGAAECGKPFRSSIGNMTSAGEADHPIAFCTRCAGPTAKSTQAALRRWQCCCRLQSAQDHLDTESRRVAGTQAGTRQISVTEAEQQRQQKFLRAVQFVVGQGRVGGQR